MTIVLSAAAILIGAVIVFAMYRYIKVSRQRKKLNAQRFDRIKPLFDKLENDQPIEPQDILPFAANVVTRHLTFQLLNSRNKIALFPKEYYSLLQSAESQLVNWLEWPTELDACPDEMEHVRRVSIDFDGQGNYIHYEVFRYRVNEPHWAAENGWILGVVGPYFDDSEPYQHAASTFSRVTSKEDEITPEEEARWVHENISLRRK